MYNDDCTRYVYEQVWGNKGKIASAHVRLARWAMCQAAVNEAFTVVSLGDSHESSATHAVKTVRGALAGHRFPADPDALETSAEAVRVAAIEAVEARLIPDGSLCRGIVEAIKGIKVTR